MNLLLKNCTFKNGNRGDILIEGEFIREISRNISPKQGCRVRDLKYFIIAPGFVNCHLHLDKVLAGADYSGQSLGESIAIFRKIKRETTKEEIKSRARIILDRAIAHGTILARTHIDIDPAIGLLGCEALLEIKEEYRDKINIQLVAFPQEGINRYPEIMGMMEEACMMGMDAVGGIPARDIDPELHVRKIFDLAEKYGMVPDFHVDESDDPEDLTIVTISEETLCRGMTGRVNVGHCCSLDALEPNKLSEVLDKIARAQLNIISLPTSNLYLQGLGDCCKSRRGIAPVKKLVDRGLKVAVASDNIQDVFVPLGNANLLQVALITAYACRMGSSSMLEKIFDMITINPAYMCGISTEIKPGSPANLVALKGKNVSEAIIEQSPVIFSVNKGKMLEL